MADGFESERRSAARSHLAKAMARLPEDQVPEAREQLLWLLIDQLSIMDVERAIDGAVKMTKRRHPTAVGAGHA